MPCIDFFFASLLFLILSPLSLPLHSGLYSCLSSLSSSIDPSLSPPASPRLSLARNSLFQIKSKEPTQQNTHARTQPPTDMHKHTYTHTGTNTQTNRKLTCLRAQIRTRKCRHTNRVSCHLMSAALIARRLAGATGAAIRGTDTAVAQLINCTVGYSGTGLNVHGPIRVMMPGTVVTDCGAAMFLSGEGHDLSIIDINNASFFGKNVWHRGRPGVLGIPEQTQMK